VGSWAVTMIDSYYVSYERSIVLTTSAIYRIQWTASAKHKQSGYLKKCRRMPLDTVFRVYQSNGRVTIIERTEQSGQWSKLVGMLTESEHQEARPWRSRSHTLTTRWYVPSLFEPGRDQATEMHRLLTEMVQGIHSVAPWTIPSPKNLPLGVEPTMESAGPPHRLPPLLVDSAPAVPPVTTGAPGEQLSAEGDLAQIHSCGRELPAGLGCILAPSSAGASSGISAPSSAGASSGMVEWPSPHPTGGDSPPVECGGDWAVPTNMLKNFDEGEGVFGHRLAARMKSLDNQEVLLLSDLAEEDPAGIDIASPSRLISRKLELPAHYEMSSTCQDRIPSLREAESRAGSRGETPWSPARSSSLNELQRPHAAHHRQPRTPPPVRTSQDRLPPLSPLSSTNGARTGDPAPAGADGLAKIAHRAAPAWRGCGLQDE